VRGYALKILRVVLPLALALVGCNRTPITHPEDTHARPAGQSASLDPQEHKSCVAHQIYSDACGAYKVLSYDATWTNEFGNQGRFLLERDSLKILAHCGSENCYRWIDAVGKAVEADKSITDLITYHLPNCEDPTYVKMALEHYKRTTGRGASIAQVCDQTLIVERIEAK
jgi:hypothetical protein